MKYFLIFFALTIIGMPIIARFHVVKNAHQLEKLVDSYEYSIVCFASAGQKEGEYLDRDDKQVRKKDFREIQDIVKATSDRFEYKKFLSKDVGFILVDVSSKQAQNLSSEYDLERDPICFVFEQGKIDKSKKVIHPASVKDLTWLLEQQGGSSLKELLKQRKQQADLERQERISQNYAYAVNYPYWGGWGGYGRWGGWGLGWGYRGYGCW